MKKEEIIILLVIVLLGGFFVFFRDDFVEQKTTIVNQEQSTSTTKSNWETKTDEQADVAVTITPIDILSQSKEWKFDVVMNTHSVELENPTKSIVLVDSQGKEYKSTNWDGPTEGHHMNGILTFNQIIPTPKSVELKVSGVDDVVRSFVWKLK